MDSVEAKDDLLEIHLSKPISIAYFTPSVYRRIDEQIDFPRFSPTFATQFLALMKQLMPSVDCFSQFPYAIDVPVFVSLCRMRCGKLNRWKRRYIAISRNCLYYFHSIDGLSEKERDEVVLQLPTGVIPLTQLASSTRMVGIERQDEAKVAGRLFIVELFREDGSDVAYLRLLTSEKVIRRAKHRFCFTFGGDWMER